MKSRLALILLLVLLLIAVYLLGRKDGNRQVKTEVVNNLAVVTQIAELSSLEVTGNTMVKISNVRNDNNYWEGLKMYFFENTLQVTVPYTAKYGVDLTQQKVTINTKDTVCNISFPPVKLLSLQLRLDQLQSMNQNGLFARTTLADLTNAEKELYQRALDNLNHQQNLVAKSQQHIADILGKYYIPLGYHVHCTFGNTGQ